MFGWGLFKKGTSRADLISWLHEARDQRDAEAAFGKLFLDKLVDCERLLEEALDENKRLFDHHNKRLTKPKRDKNGNYHAKDGKFTKAR